MRPILDHILRRVIQKGVLRVRYPGGDTVEYQGAPGPKAGVVLASPAVVRGLVLSPNLTFGNGYVDGGIQPLDCSLYELLELLTLNLVSTGGHPVVALQRAVGIGLKRWAQFNPADQARRNVAHHYDLNGRLYSLLLDRDRQYSCAYFPRADATLEEAQEAKKHHIAAKLLLRPGLRVLDIGCGWGGLALTLARDYGAEVTGITLSTEQLEAARQRARQEGLDHQVRFELLDYRHLRERFDRVVSVGMFEHVGIGHYRTFFSAVRRALAPDGVSLIHTIARSGGPGVTNPWLAKYIFPGGYSPALSEVLPAVERSGLWTTDIEILRLHYAETLRHWRRNLLAKRDAIAALYDDRFCRMFDLYLTGSELAFRYGRHMVAQLQLAADVGAVPLTREYMWEREHQALHPATDPLPR